MRNATLLAALIVAGGCSSGGDRGQAAPVSSKTNAASTPPIEAMPPQAGASAKAAMERGASMSAQYDKMYGKK